MFFQTTVFFLILLGFLNEIYIILTTYLPLKGQNTIPIHQPPLYHWITFQIFKIKVIRQYYNFLYIQRCRVRGFLLKENCLG